MIKTMIATSVVALGLATGAMADSHFSGAYVGGNFGYGFGKTDYNKNETVADKAKTDMGTSGFVGGFHGGYQHQFGMFVVGAEAAFNLSNTEAKNTDGAEKESLKRKHAFGLAGRLGVAINSWMAYTKLGWERARFDFRHSGEAVVANNFSKKKSLNGFVAGLGFETVVANNMMVGAEWM